MLRKTFLVLLLILATGIGAQLFAQYVVNFEGSTETKTSYASGTVNLSGVNWDMTESLIGNSTSDWKNGTKSARMRGYAASSMTMLADNATGLGILSFQYRRYGTDAQVDWKAEYSTDGGANWTQVGAAFTAPASDVVQNFSETVNVAGNVRVRIKRATESGAANARLNIDDITLTDYTGGSTPVIIVAGSLNAFSTYTGTPSASQSYNLSGTNLTANIVVTPPAGFEVSTNNTTFTSTVSVANTFNGPVYVRLTGAAAGSFGGNITHTSTGASQVDLAATGTVSDPVPTIHVTGTLNAFSAITGTPSASQSYTLSGSFLTANILVTPPAGFEVSTENTTFTSTVSVASSYNGPVYVRLTGTTAGSYSGNITHTSTGATQVDLAVSGSVTDPMGPTTFLEENFIYTAGTTLVSNGWIAHSGTGTNSPTVTDYGLLYAGYPPVLGFAGQTTNTGEDVHRNFTPQTNGTVYTSFLIKVTSATEAGDYVYHFATNVDNTSDFKAKLFVGRDASNNVRFGLTKQSNVGTNVAWTGYNYALNTTYLVVLKYEIIGGATNDLVSGWINPAIGATEPSAQLVGISTETDIGTAGIGSVGIRQSNASLTAVFDGIRVTNNWAQLWNGDVPPTPVISVTGTPDYLYSIAGSPTDPGEITSYQLAGDNLVGPITVNAPENFEVSTNGVDGWADTIQVPASYSGSIYVRLYAPTAGEYGGDISHTSAGAEEVLLRVDGEALAPDVVWNLTNNMVPFAGVVGEASDIQSYSLSATNAVAPIDITVMDGPFEFATSPTGPWTTSGSLPSTFSGNIYVKMLTTTAGSFNGSIKHTTTNASELFVYPSGVVDPPAGVYATDLFFSEYIEGSSNNKAVEIFNGTGAPVDLSNYKVELYANGSATPGNTLTFTAGTMLAHNDVYVIANAGANATILAQSDVTSTVTYFNGDDALALKKISTDAYVDIFGVLGNDPDGTANNTGWTADGGYSTMNKTLVRKPTVTQGISVNPPNPGTGISTGFLTLATEWDVYAIDTLDYLGAHTFTPGMEVAAAPVILPAGGIQTGPVNVTMSSTTPGAVIYYTLDGSVPTDGSTAYATPFNVSTTTTVKAITYATGYAPSAVTEVEYIYPTLVSTIATLRTMPTGTTNIYKLTTEAVLTFQQVSRNQKYIQDATAAIVIDDAAGVITTTYNLYDGITGITGTLGLYSGLLQFTPVVNAAPATSTGNVVVPEVRTMASLTTADQAKLIKVMNVTLDTALGTFPATAANINATDPTATLVMRTFPNADYSGTDIPATAVNVTCLVGEYNTTMQISPRFLADFEAAAGQLTSPTVTISYVGGGIQLDWDPIAGATSYRVEHSDDPYTGFTTLDTTTNDYYIFIPAAGTASKFYQVIAVP